MPQLGPRTRKIFGRVLLVAFPPLIAFGFAELALRVGEPASREDDVTAKDFRWLAVDTSAELGWIFPADTTGVFKSSGRHTPVTTNSLGLRGPEVSSDPDTRRVLFLGDSYTFGWGVADSAGFVRLMESELRGQFPETPIECVNGGLPGYSIYQQIRMLAYVRRHTEIHAVVATISLANDPIDEMRIRRFAPDRLADFSYDLRDPDTGTAHLIASSRVLTLIDQRTTHLQFSLINTSGECRDLADESLRELAATCREAGLPLIWVIVPRAQEIRSESFWKGLLNRATDDLRGHFLELATGPGVPAIDLKPALTKTQAEGDAYLPADAHWNEEGHHAVMQSVMPALVEAWFDIR